MNFILLVGYIVIYVGGSITLLIGLGMLLYWVYNIWLNKILDCDDDVLKKELIYFIRNEKEIKEIIALRKKKK